MCDMVMGVFGMEKTLEEDIFRNACDAESVGCIS